MIIRFDEGTGILTIDGTRISAGVIRAVVNPDNRLLWRFSMRDGIIGGTAYSDSDAIWIDPPTKQKEAEQSIEFGVSGEL